MNGEGIYQGIQGMKKLSVPKNQSALAHSAHIILMICLIGMIQMFNEKKEKEAILLQLKENETLSVYHSSR